MSAPRWLVVCALVGCASGSQAPDVGGDDDAFVVDDKGDRVARSAAWLRAEVDRWNRHLDAGARAEKYAKLAESPFTFFRGTNHLFWRDHATRADLARYGGDARTATWIQGDCHLDNFGTFDDDEGRVVYGLNDFDDAWVADVQLDVWRLATSIVLWAREHDVADDEAGAAVDAMAGAYLDAMHGFRGNDGELERDDVDGVLAELVDEAEEEGGTAALLARWTDGAGRFDLGNADLAAPTAAEVAAVAEALDGHVVRDVARRLHAGTGSLGALRYYVLVDDDVILDVKAARRTPGQAYVGDLVAASTAEIAAASQRALGVEVDGRLGAVWIDGAPFLVRTLSPYKESLSTKDLRAHLVEAAAGWGALLAAAHARGDQDHDESLVPYSIDKQVDARAGADPDGFRALVWSRAASYARRVVADHAAFVSTL